VIALAQTLAGWTRVDRVCRGSWNRNSAWRSDELAALTRAFRRHGRRRFLRDRLGQAERGPPGRRSGVTGPDQGRARRSKRTDPAKLHFERPQSEIDLGEQPFSSTRASGVEKPSGMPEGGSAFGVGGTNAPRACLEEAPAPNPPPRPPAAVSFCALGKTATRSSATRSLDGTSPRSGADLAEVGTRCRSVARALPAAARSSATASRTLSRA